MPEEKLSLTQWMALRYIQQRMTHHRDRFVENKIGQDYFVQVVGCLIRDFGDFIEDNRPHRIEEYSDFPDGEPVTGNP